jgi:ABC-type lipoprotein release transport system permease subunit
VVVGLAGAFAVTRLMRSLLFGIEATDPLTFLAVPALLALSALGASYLPARRAAAIDPVRSLRSE